MLWTQAHNARNHKLQKCAAIKKNANFIVVEMEGYTGGRFAILESYIWIALLKRRKHAEIIGGVSITICPLAVHSWTHSSWWDVGFTHITKAEIHNLMWLHLTNELAKFLSTVAPPKDQKCSKLPPLSSIHSEHNFRNRFLSEFSPELPTCPQASLPPPAKFTKFVA